jgi:2,3-bisphosphoglycerate-independent phosphoglycerate mutase
VPAFVDHFGVRGAAVVVSLLPRGVARLCGLEVEPALAAGPLASLGARVERALALAAACEFVLLHVETVDQTGPRGNAAAKAEAITRLDADVLAPLVTGLRAAGGDWRLAVLADLTSSSAARRYTADPVPFVVASPRDAGRASAPRRRFTERDAREEGIFLGEAHTLLERLLRR